MSYSSTKHLWHLVTEQSLQASDQVMATELRAELNMLRRGIRFYQPNSDSTREAFLGARKKSVGHLAKFVVQLATLIHVEEEQAKKILSAYLASKFFSQGKEF